MELSCRKKNYAKKKLVTNKIFRQKNFLVKNPEELKSITYLTKKNKNKRLIINGCWTEEAKFSKSKTISNNLSSLKFLINSETKDSFELFEYSKNNFSTKKDFYNYWKLKDNCINISNINNLYNNLNIL